MEHINVKGLPEPIVRGLEDAPNTPRRFPCLTVRKRPARCCV
jgi:hypothetical protein